jgi:hypothetical protein
MDNFLELFNDFEQAIIEARENHNERYLALRSQLLAAWDASQREAAQAAELRDDLKELRTAAQAFAERVGAWGMAQDEDTKLSTALAFGEEYEALQMALG